MYWGGVVLIHIVLYSLSTLGSCYLLRNSNRTTALDRCFRYFLELGPKEIGYQKGQNFNSLYPNC